MQFKSHYANRYAVISILVLILGLMLSILGSKFLFDYNKQQQQLWIERHAESQSEQLQISINSALSALSTISAFFKVQDNIKQEQFLKFVKSDAAKNAGIIALAWVPRISHVERQQFELSLNKYLRGSRSITEMNSHGLLVPAPIRDEYYPVEHLFSESQASLFIGLNLTSQISTRKGLDAAIKTGQLHIPNFKKGVVSENPNAELQAYFPVYELQQSEENSYKQEDLIGLVVGVYDVKTLISNTFQNNIINLAIFDMSAVNNNQLLYKSDTVFMHTLNLNNMHDLSKLATPYWTRYFEVGNSKWLGVFFAENEHNASSSVWLPYMGLLTGIVITSLLAIYLFIALFRGKEIHNLKYKLIDSEHLITNQNSVLQAQNVLKQKLEKESYEKTRFLHALSHDLRQPLSTLGLYLAQLQAEHINDQQVLDKTRLTLLSLNNMFESLLQMTRLDAGIIEPEKLNIDLGILFDELGQEFELPLNKKGLTLHTRCNVRHIHSDPILLERILRNLVGNAIKYTSSGRILLASRRLNNKVYVYVMDTGDGMNEKLLSHLFTPYTRGDETSSESGLGLGLAIVKQTCELLNHQIEVFSKPGKGTCFRIVISNNSS